MADSGCCQAFIADSLRGVSLLIAVAGFAAALGGAHGLPGLTLKLADLSEAWFAVSLSYLGTIQVLVGLVAAAGLHAAFYTVSLRCCCFCLCDVSSRTGQPSKWRS
jgi:hypothetical protein